MLLTTSRRRFVGNGLKAGLLTGLGDFAFLRGLSPVSAVEARLAHEKVQLSTDIEPLVKLIEDTPREKLFEAVAGQMRRGTGYQQLLTGLFLAGVRGIQPRPVGFKFHAVLVVNSAHLAAQAMPDKERWLPLFWALDNFKNSQERNRQEGDWSMAAVEEGKLPSSSQARPRFVEAMDNWDEEGADRAIVSLVRHAGAGEIIELLWRYGSRDFRDIGHKAIYVANAWRTLQAIGWRHAEPVLRSLAYALLEHEKGNPARRDDEQDRPGRDNVGRAAKIRAEWQSGTSSADGTLDLLKAMRRATHGEACDQIVQLLNKGLAPASVWDALFLRAGELLMQQPGIIGVHCVTSVNALHYGYQTSGNNETRKILLLQAAAFLALFYRRMAGNLKESLQVDVLEKLDPHSKDLESIGEILSDVSKDRVTAARKVLAVATSSPSHVEALMLAARRLVFSKGNDSHDYKFSSAALEDFHHTSSPWRARFLATTMFQLRGSGERDNSLIARVRETMKSA